MAYADEFTDRSGLSSGQRHPLWSVFEGHKEGYLDAFWRIDMREWRCRNKRGDLFASEVNRKITVPMCRRRFGLIFAQKRRSKPSKLKP